MPYLVSQNRTCAGPQHTCCAESDLRWSTIYLMSKIGPVLSGMSGLLGLSGQSGLSGLSGLSGRSGQSGLSGLSGLSDLSGLSGLSGVPTVLVWRVDGPPSCGEPGPQHNW